MRFVAGLGGILLAALVALAPAALGSDRPLAWAVNAIVAGAALALIVAGRLGSGQRQGFGPVAVPAVLFALVAAWAAAQCLPLGPPLADPAWGYAPAGAGPGSVSINPEVSLWRLTELLTAAAVFAGAFLLARQAGWAAALLRVFQGGAALYALYGFLRVGVLSGKILWFDAAVQDRLGGPFVGPNNAATYFGLAAIVGFAFLMRALRRTGEAAAERQGSYRLAAIVGALPGALGRELVLFFVPFTALLATASRAGTLFTLAGCLMILLLQALRRPGSASTGGRFAMLAAIAAAFFLLALILELGGTRLSLRLLVQGLGSGLRNEVAQTTLAAVGDHWLTGTGPGSFADLFMLYQDDVLHGDYAWDKAHNDYLELALGLGLPAAGTFLAALALLAGRALRGTLARRRNSSYPMVAVGATVLVALHSLVDFSLQIQAIALSYAMLLGVGVAQSESSRG